MQHVGSGCAHLLGCFSGFLPPGGCQHSSFCGLLQSSSTTFEGSERSCITSGRCAIHEIHGRLCTSKWVLSRAQMAKLLAILGLLPREAAGTIAKRCRLIFSVFSLWLSFDSMCCGWIWYDLLRLDLLRLDMISSDLT